MEDYKGGYQTIDLTGVGDTATTIDGVFNKFKYNNGKPILIKTPSGDRVFAKVKENPLGSYSATYLDGEDIILVTVYSDDGVLIENLGSSDTTAISNKITALESTVYADEFKAANAVDLSGYGGTQVSDKYLAPADGYVWIRVANVATNHVQVNIQSNDRSNTYDEHVWGNASGNTDRTVFVKKGFYLFTVTNVGTGNNMVYIPFE